jgi:succinyl-diaminopimelate desuccinylase
VLGLLIKLKEKYEKLGSRFPGRFNKFTTVNIGKIAGGVKVNSVPDFCTLSVDCRISPDYRTSDILEEVEQGLREPRERGPIFPIPA